MKNGTCIKIINSFIAEYNVTSTNNSIYLMNLLKNFINFSNIEMYIDDKRVFPYIIQKNRFAGIYAYPEDYYDDVFVSYKFDKLGIIRVKIIINQNITRLQNSFALCKDLVKISFSESFDTSYVQSTQFMFYKCESLTDVDLSSFNTSLVNNYNSMFNSCIKLTSLNLSNFEAKYSCGFHGMLSGIPSVAFIDISSLYSIYPECNMIYLNYLGPDNGTVISNRKCKIDLKKSWNIIYVD